jgi:hypothetical protein
VAVGRESGMGLLRGIDVVWCGVSEWIYDCCSAECCLSVHAFARISDIGACSYDHHVTNREIFLVPINRAGGTGRSSLISLTKLTRAWLATA